MAGLLWYRSYMDSLANTSGYYPDIHAGHADRVAELTLDAPYMVRETPAGYNKLELSSIIGGSVAWNQLFKAAGASTINGIAFTRSADLSTQTMNGTATANVYRSLPDITSTVVNHIYYVSQEYAITGVQIYNDSAGVSTQGNKETIGKATAVKGWFIRVASGTTLDNVSIRPLIIDLTQMLRPAIVDYVYSLEQNSAGSGIAWLKSYDLIDDQYHAYSDPTLQSVEATSHITKDGNGNVISTTTFGSITLRGITELDNGTLKYNGDTYEPDGTVTRKWGEVTFNGSENWVAYDIYNGFWVSLPAMKSGGYLDGKTNYLTVNNAFTQTGVVLGAGNSVVYCTHITDTISGVTDLASWKTYLSNHPLTLVYELATQTTESADPYTAVQDIEEGGTEEFVMGNNVPVGNVSIYRRA